MIRRLSYANLPNIDELIEQVYGSEDFKRGVQNFVAKNKGVPQWSGSDLDGVQMWPPTLPLDRDVLGFGELANAVM